jgi:hypothetical protein
MPKHFNDYQVTKFEELVSLVAAAMEDWEYEMSTRVVARAVLVALLEADELREFRPPPQPLPIGVFCDKALYITGEPVTPHTCVLGADGRCVLCNAAG